MAEFQELKASITRIVKMPMGGERLRMLFDQYGIKKLADLEVRHYDALLIELLEIEKSALQGTRDIIADYLKNCLTFELGYCPEFHGGERGPLYLVVKLGDERIATIDRRMLDAVGKEEEF